MGTIDEPRDAAPIDRDPNKPPPSSALDPQDPNLKPEGAGMGAGKSVKKPRRKQLPASKTGKYALRSSAGGGRVLRSMSSAERKKEIETPQVAAAGPSVSGSVKGRRRKKRKGKSKSGEDDEFARVRYRVGYYLRRMSYEQSLVEAYAAEGWKGMSLEKIRPEKELERAKSEIIRCKLKIRDLFQQLDSLLSEGSFDDSLFDANGQIDSEDIFCAKCGLKDLSVGNDIILCDGVCNRGFHQKCLIPPLLNEDIPSGDEGWLCPGCDCKLECIDLLNELQGTNIKLEDKWEKIFLEAAVANKNNSFNDLGLPSDDSEDEDFAPDASKVDDEEENDSEENDTSSSEDSDYTDESDVPNTNGFSNGVPWISSDDSEDDDYDPDKIDTDKISKEDGSGLGEGSSSSNESDFTSDSEDSGALNIGKETESNTFSSLPQSGGKASRNPEITSINTELFSLNEPHTGPCSFASSPSKRKRKNMDENKLCDANQNVTSDSEDNDETWTADVSKKLRHEVTCKGFSNRKTWSKKGRGKVTSGTDEDVPSTHSARRHKNLHVDTVSQANIQDSTLLGAHLHSSQKPSNELLETTITSSCKGSLLNSGGNSTGKNFKKAVSQRLLESFNGNQYPTAETKKNLAEELGITVKQVQRWFNNTRHSFRVAANGPASIGHNSLKGATPPESVVFLKSGKNNDGEHSSDPKDSQCITTRVESASETFDLKTSTASPQSAGRKSKAAMTDRDKLVLRELRKLKRGH